jgi:hypothetical protein
MLSAFGGRGEDRTQCLSAFESYAVQTILLAIIIKPNVQSFRKLIISLETFIVLTTYVHHTTTKLAGKRQQKDKVSANFWSRREIAGSPCVVLNMDTIKNGRCGWILY